MGAPLRRKTDRISGGRPGGGNLIAMRRLFLLVRLALIGCLFAASAPAQLPPSPGAPKVGEKAPDFTLPDSTGKAVKLSEILAPASAEQKPASWVLVIFYRGYW